jgi:hypothetical protein
MRCSEPPSAVAELEVVRRFYACPMNEEPPKPTDYVAAWITAHRNEIGGTQQKFAWREEYSRAFCTEFETRKYLIQFCAWDHACCLDILTLNKATGETDYIVAGECEGVTGLTQRLDAFLHWLGVNELNRNA